MCFEQNLIGDAEYYNQDKNGWKTWCDNHFEQIKLDFAHDMKTMSVSNQRYFGDWVSYNGHGDVGYYLGCRLCAIFSQCMNLMKLFVSTLTM